MLLNSTPISTPAAMTLADFTSPGLVIPYLRGQEVATVIQELSQAMHREKRVPDFRNIMWATTATSFTCNDPNDKFGMDVCGFDTTAPSVVADFIRGEAVTPEPVED